MDKWINFGDGFLLVFAIDDAESFEFVKGIHERILKSKHGAKGPILLVGNKQDIDHKRKVNFNEAKSLANSWGFRYIETSAKTNFNCKEVFEILLKTIVAMKKNDRNGKKNKCNIF